MVTDVCFESMLFFLYAVNFGNCNGSFCMTTANPPHSPFEKGEIMHWKIRLCVIFSGERSHTFYGLRPDYRRHNFHELLPF